MLYKEIPFLRFTPPLAVGILLRYVSGCTISWIALLIILCLVLIVFIFSGDRKQNILYGSAVYLFLIASGIALYSYRYKDVTGFRAEPAFYSIRIDKMPVLREKSIKVAATLMLKTEAESFKPGSKIMLYFPVASSISEQQAGDLIHLYLRPEKITDFDTLDNFDYRIYMLHRGYNYISFAGDYKELEEAVAGIKHKSIIIQHKLLKKYAFGINNERSLSIISALTLGYRDIMEEEVKEKFRDAGISHIMAVSGLHVGIISVLIMGLLSLARIRSGVLCFIIILASIWCFALISGMSPSVMRASIMFSFLYTGRFIGRHVNPVNSLLASAFILLVADPFILFSVGFQLSYSAVLSILLFFKKLDKLFNFTGLILRKTWSLISITLLAQAGTLPFVLYHFGSLPLLSVFSNIFAIPLTFIIILTGALFLLTPSYFFIHDWLSALIVLETKLLYSIADWISSLI